MRPLHRQNPSHLTEISTTRSPTACLIGGRPAFDNASMLKCDLSVRLFGTDKCCHVYLASIISRYYPIWHFFIEAERKSSNATI